MPDTKITALTALTAADPANDVLPIVDVSDTSMAASGTTKKISVNNILGCSGTATLASATITGDLTVDTTTLKVDSTNNRVGIGTASPTAGMVLDIVSATSNNFVRFTDSVNATGYLGITSGGSAYLHGNNNLVSLSCSTSNTTPTEQLRITNPGVFNFLDGAGGSRMLLNSNGLGLGVTPTAGAGVLQLSSGINFPATQVASANANTLDDYEEGTFTPTVRGSTTAGTGTYTTQFGRYTKVGRLVTVTVTLVWTAHTGTGNLQFAGLPFTSANTSGAYDGVCIGYQTNIASAANTVLYGLIEFGSTVVTMSATPVGGGSYGLVAMDTAGEIAFTATYTV